MVQVVSQKILVGIKIFHKTRSHLRIKSSELTAANRRIANTHLNDLRMKLP